MLEILVRNDLDILVVLLKRTRLGKVIEYEAKECYMVNPDS